MSTPYNARMEDNSAQPYAALTPDCVLDALESLDLRCDGRLLALNSYENRVYQIWMEEGPPVVAKFYRPQRWTAEQILEEHDYVAELARNEIPVVAASVYGGKSLHEHGGYRFAVYAKRGGRAPEFDRPEVLEWMGRFIARIHSVGGQKSFRARPALDIQSFGAESRDWLLAHGFVPADLLPAYESVVAQALEGVAHCYERAGKVGSLRLHGDCHAGNVLWTDEGPHFVDFDDARSGPAIQDIWMLLSGDREGMTNQLREVISGYEDFCEFDKRELHLIEALRTLRLIHYSAWIARRWEDPAFPAAFPWFNTQRYWQDRILELREQIALMNEPPLALMPA
ncbi:MAG TPA: serine/threonine protein kinase [Burkholderiales bacterium]|nr:serine/threonine protein kinase [Burkholderiales bacterium]